MAASAVKPAREPVKGRPARQEKAGLSFKERKEYEELLAQIDELEKEQRALEAGFLQPSLDPSERQKNDRRWREIAGLLETRMARWEELAGRAGD